MGIMISVPNSSRIYNLSAVLFAGFGFDAGFSVVGVMAALRAILLQHQAFRVVFLIFIACVIPAFALGAGQPEPTVFDPGQTCHWITSNK